MAFVSLASTLIQVGKALKKEIFQTIKDNLDDHETRLQTFEGAAKKVVVFDELIGNAASAASLTGLSCWRAPSAFTLIDAKITWFDKTGLTGTLEMNVRKASSTDDSAAVSVFTTRPSLATASDASYAESSNAAFDNNQKEIAEGDYLFLDISSLPTPVITKFKVYLVGEV